MAPAAAMVVITTMAIPAPQGAVPLASIATLAGSAFRAIPATAVLRPVVPMAVADLAEAAVMGRHVWEASAASAPPTA